MSHTVVEMRSPSKTFLSSRQLRTTTNVFRDRTQSYEAPQLKFLLDLRRVKVNCLRFFSSISINRLRLS